jgi:large subunit ribosomal protein L4
VVENINFEAPKTKSFLAVMSALALSDEKVLVVIPESNSNLSLSVRNIPNAKVVIAENLNTYDVMNASRLLVAEGAVNTLNELLA